MLHFNRDDAITQRVAVSYLQHEVKKKQKGNQMNTMQLVVFLLIGGVAGWLAGLLIKGRGFGILGNIVIGVIGAILGGWLFGVLGISVGGEWVGPLVTATVGAVLLLFAIGLVRKK